jgi:hypothetical protein
MKTTKTKKIEAGLIGILLTLVTIGAIMSSASYGDIDDAVVSSYNLNALGSYHEISGQLVRINDSDYYLTAYSDDNPANDGFMQTFMVYETNGTVHQALIDSWEFNETYGRFGSLGHINGTDKYVINFMGETYQTTSTFIVYENNGTIHKSMLSTATGQPGKESCFIQFTDNIWIAAHSDNSEDGWLETYWIDDDGTVNDTELDTEEYDGTLGRYPDVCIIDSNTIALVYTDVYSGNADLVLMTYNISATTGLIDDDPADSWLFESDAYYNAGDIKKIGDNHIAVSFSDASRDLNIKTIPVDSTGAITESFADTVEIEGTGFGNNILFMVNDPNTFGADGIIGWVGTINDDDGGIYTFNITNTGTLGNSYVDFLEFETSSCLFSASILNINETNFYVMAYTGPASNYYSKVATVNISTSLPVAEEEGVYEIDGLSAGTPDYFPFTGEPDETVYPTGDVTMSIYTNLSGNTTENCTEIYIQITNLNAELTVEDFAIYLINASDGDFAEVAFALPFDGTGNLTLNATTWAEGLAGGWINGTNPFPIENEDVTIELRMACSIPTATPADTYTATDWSVIWKVISTA